MNFLEWLGIKIYKSSVAPPKGLERTLEKIRVSLGIRILPRICIFPDPHRYSLVLRSFGGNGVIFISQGLLVTATEDEMKQVLSLGLFKLKEFGIAFRSFRTLSLLSLWNSIPRSWLGLNKGDSLSVHSALGCWIFYSIYPWISTFRSLYINSVGEECRGLVYLGRER